jgi:hypothetical protein
MNPYLSNAFKSVLLLQNAEEESTIQIQPLRKPVKPLQKWKSHLNPTNESGISVEK